MPLDLRPNFFGKTPPTPEEIRKLIAGIKSHLITEYKLNENGRFIIPTDAVQLRQFEEIGAILGRYLAARQLQLGLLQTLRAWVSEENFFILDEFQKNFLADLAS